MQCPYFDAARCRSCSELATPYAAQLAAKQSHCRALLARHAPVEWLEPIASPETGFRNKAKMVIAGTVDAPTLGILDASGQGIDLSRCQLYPRALLASFAPLAEFITRARITPYDVVHRRGELKHLLITLAENPGELMLRFVLRSQEPIARIRKHLPGLQADLPELVVVSANLQPEHKAVLEGEHEILLTSRDRLTMRLNGLPMYLRPQSFFQTNDKVAAALYAQAREWVGELHPQSVWDLFCGVGGFALHAASGASKVIGVEISHEAIASANQSRDELDLANVHFLVGDSTRFVQATSDAADLVIVNPPRRGIGIELAALLDASRTRHIVYSSCNAESLARDLDAMPGFRPVRARLLDMFPHTRHYEVLTLLART